MSPVLFVFRLLTRGRWFQLRLLAVAIYRHDNFDNTVFVV